VKSGPDVFADALVPQAGTIDARRLVSQNPDICIIAQMARVPDAVEHAAPPESRDARSRARCAASGARDHSSGYRFAKSQGKSNIANGRNPGEICTPVMSQPRAPAIRLRRIHRDT